MQLALPIGRVIRMVIYVDPLVYFDYPGKDDCKIQWQHGDMIAKQSERPMPKTPEGRIRKETQTA